MSGSSTPAENPPIPPADFIELRKELTLSDQIFASNLRQQVMICRHKALSLILIATVAKAISNIYEDPTTDLTAVKAAIASVKSVINDDASLL